MGRRCGVRCTCIASLAERKACTLRAPRLCIPTCSRALPLPTVPHSPPAARSTRGGWRCACHRRPTRPGVPRVPPAQRQGGWRCVGLWAARLHFSTTNTNCLQARPQTDSTAHGRQPQAYVAMSSQKGSEPSPIHLQHMLHHRCRHAHRVACRGRMHTRHGRATRSSGDGPLAAPQLQMRCQQQRVHCHSTATA